MYFSRLYPIYQECKRVQYLFISLGLLLTEIKGLAGHLKNDHFWSKKALGLCLLQSQTTWGQSSHPPPPRPTQKEKNQLPKTVLWSSYVHCGAPTSLKKKKKMQRFFVCLCFCFLRQGFSVALESGLFVLFFKTFKLILLGAREMALQLWALAGLAADPGFSS